MRQARVMVDCDGAGCNSYVELDYMPLDDIDDELRANGWSVEYGDYCPRCTRERELKNANTR